MPTVDAALLRTSERIQAELWKAAKRYMDTEDVRWMFAFAHYRITQQINASLKSRPHLWRDPNRLMRFNATFALAFIEATQDMGSAPWKQAFAQCAAVEKIRKLNEQNPVWSETGQVMNLNYGENVLFCAVAMADAHIHVDIRNSLRKIGCIDTHDYGNVLLFVNQAAKDSIFKLQGTAVGTVMNHLKLLILPLEEIWRNAVYTEYCGVPVPKVERAFEIELERKLERLNTRW
jgi:hypothetical protein